MYFHDSSRGNMPTKDLLVSVPNKSKQFRIQLVSVRRTSLPQKDHNKVLFKSTGIILSIIFLIILQKRDWLRTKWPMEWQMTPTLFYLSPPPFKNCELSIDRWLCFKVRSPSAHSNAQMYDCLWFYSPLNEWYNKHAGRRCLPIPAVAMHLKHSYSKNGFKSSVNSYLWHNNAY